MGTQAAGAASRFLAIAASLGLVLAACGGTTPSGSGGGTAGGECDESETVTIGFSAPAADHGWLGAVISGAEEEAALHDDVEFRSANGGTDADQQANNIRTLAEQDLDAIAILPYDGAALTPVAQELMDRGIAVINIDREFSSPTAFRTWIGGDNYGIGRSAGLFLLEELADLEEAIVVEIQGIAGISVTDLRTAGFMDAIEGSNITVVASQPGDFNADTGREVMETILQANEHIDAVYTHDDDMAEGVVQAIRNAGREDEMILTGAGGSANAMAAIQEGGIYAATFLYNPIMAASAVNLARLVAHGCGMSDLAESQVPQRIQLDATTVTQENVDQYEQYGF
ncbi:MAG TPA: substrate-binding domain-containing protein [Candidatus Limnocylindria bacterium]